MKLSRLLKAIFELPMLLMKFRDINVLSYSLEVGWLGWLMVDPIMKYHYKCATRSTCRVQMKETCWLVSNSVFPDLRGESDAEDEQGVSEEVDVVVEHLVGRDQKVTDEAHQPRVSVHHFVLEKAIKISVALLPFPKSV